MLRFTRTFVLALTTLLLVVGLAATPVSADRSMMQLSATGNPFSDIDCTAVEADAALPIEGNTTGWSLNGCLYQFWGPGTFTPSGAYQEVGTELFIGELWIDGQVAGSGTFETEYRFTGKFEDGDFAKEIFGRCQHPIVAGTGTGVFDGAEGRLDFKDVLERDDDGFVVDVRFPLRGHLRLG